MTTSDDFYVTLPSDASTDEFQANAPNHFTVRLPRPLHLPGEGWKVGLSSLSLPDTRANLDRLVPKQQYLFSLKWFVLRNGKRTIAPDAYKRRAHTPPREDCLTRTMTAVPLHQGSASAVNDALQLFDLPPTDTSMTAARMLEFTPISQGINPMEFVVPGVDAFIDLSRSYFTMKLRLRKQIGTNIDAGDVFYPANNLAHTLIKQLSCHLNGTLISPQNDSYAYKAYLENRPQLQRPRSPHPLATAGLVPHPTRHDDHRTGFSHPLDGQQRGRGHPARPLYGPQSPPRKRPSSCPKKNKSLTKAGPCAPWSSNRIRNCSI